MKPTPAASLVPSAEEVILFHLLCHEPVCAVQLYASAKTLHGTKNELAKDTKTMKRSTVRSFCAQKWNMWALRMVLLCYHREIFLGNTQYSFTYFFIDIILWTSLSVKNIHYTMWNFLFSYVILSFLLCFLSYNGFILPRGASHRFFFLIKIFYLRSRSMPYSIELGTSSMGGIPIHTFDLIGKFPWKPWGEIFLEWKIE